MKITKTTNINQGTDKYLKSVDNDLINIFNAFKGRVRFGVATSGYRGENIEGEYRTFTSGASNIVVAHTMNTAPTGFLVTNKGGFGDIYMVSGTSLTVTFATSASSTSYTVFLLK